VGLLFEEFALPVKNATKHTGSSADWKEASRRAKILWPLLEHRKFSKTLVDGALEELGLSASSFYPMLSEFRKSPYAETLLVKKRGNRKDQTRLSEGCEAIIQRHIEEDFLKREPVSVVKLHILIRKSCLEAENSEKPPSYGAVLARTKAIRGKLKTKKQKGKKAASDKYDPVLGFYEADQVFEKIQIDHTLCDIILVDDIYRLPVARPWVSLAIDIASRDIPAYYLTFDSPSRISVAMTMGNMATDNSAFIEKYPQLQQSSCHGIPDLVHFDNAKEFHSNSVTYGCDRYGMEIKYRKIKVPKYGGHIERLIGTQMGEVHFLPGTTMSNVAERGDYDSEKHAFMTLSEFTEWFALQIHAYRNKIHSSLERPPVAVYDELLANRPTLVRQPASPEQFMMDFLPFEMRKIRREGMQLFNVFYWSEVLTAWVDQVKHKCLVHYDPRDMSRIFLQAPDGEVYHLPYRDSRRPRVTLWEMKKAKRALREKGQSEYDEAMIFEVIDQQRALIVSALGKSKAARRSSQKISDNLKAASLAYQSQNLLIEETKRLRAPESQSSEASNIQGFEVEDY
jgi:putative transposase